MGSYEAADFVKGFLATLPTQGKADVADVCKLADLANVAAAEPTLPTAAAAAAPVVQQGKPPATYTALNVRPATALNANIVPTAEMTVPDPVGRNARDMADGTAAVARHRSAEAEPVPAPAQLAAVAVAATRMNGEFGACRDAIGAEAGAVVDPAALLHAAEQTLELCAAVTASGWDTASKVALYGQLESGVACFEFVGRFRDAFHRRLRDVDPSNANAVALGATVEQAVAADPTGESLAKLERFSQVWSDRNGVPKHVCEWAGLHHAQAKHALLHDQDPGSAREPATRHGVKEEEEDGEEDGVDKQAAEVALSMAANARDVPVPQTTLDGTLETCPDRTYPCCDPRAAPVVAASPPAC